MHGEPFAPSTSAFCSAYEGLGLEGVFTAAATPVPPAPLARLSSGGQLLRLSSGEEDALLAATGHPTFAQFAQQVCGWGGWVAASGCAAHAPHCQPMTPPLLSSPPPQAHFFSPSLFEATPAPPQAPQQAALMPVCPLAQLPFAQAGWAPGMW